MNWYKKSQNTPNTPLVQSLIDNIDSMQFENNHMGSHHQQHDFELVAKINSVSVGVIEYNEFRGEIHISYIIVRPELRRHKIGTRMIEELKRINPNMLIHWGVMSDDGSRLKESLEK